MKHLEFKWTARDGIQLYAREWAPEAKEPRAVICLVHGYAEHSERYLHVAEAFTNSGLVLMAFDLRGHGKSEGKRGHTPDYETLMDDISLLLDEAARRHPDLPCFLYGHSMGGNMVLNYVLRRRPEIKGVVASSPWLSLTKEPPRIMTFLAKIMDKIAPAGIQKVKLNAADLSHDPVVVKAYQDDPLIFNDISFRLFTGIHDSGRWAVDYASIFPLPLLIMHGGADPVTSPEASKKFASRVPSQCTLKIWEGLYHETHNEFEKQDVITYVKGWLESYL